MLLFKTIPPPEFCASCFPNCGSNTFREVSSINEMVWEIRAIRIDTRNDGDEIKQSHVIDNCAANFYLRRNEIG